LSSRRSTWSVRMSKSFLSEYHASSTKCSFCMYVKLIIVYSEKLYLKYLFFLKKKSSRIRRKRSRFYTRVNFTLCLLMLINLSFKTTKNCFTLSPSFVVLRAVEPLQYKRMYDWVSVYPQGAIQASAADTTMNRPYAFSWVKRSYVLFSRRRHVALQLTGRESLTCILNTSIFFWSCMWVSSSPKW